MRCCAPRNRVNLLLLVAAGITLMLPAGCTRRACFPAPTLTHSLWSCQVSRAPHARAEAAYSRARQLEKEGDAACVDAYFRTCTVAWPELQQHLACGNRENGRLHQLYHSALIRLVQCGQRFRRLDPATGLWVRTDGGWMTVAVTCSGFPENTPVIDELIPVGNYETQDLSHYYRCCGVGATMVTRHCRRPGERFMRKNRYASATVLLRNPDADDMGPWVLELFEPHRISSVWLGGQPVPLARDLSAPIALALSQANREYLTGFLQPGSTDENGGLFMTAPWQPDKIPVVFVHGLLSDPFTWANLVNELQARPDLFDRYQFWGFEYATGEEFLESAAILRRQLEEARMLYDPYGSSPAFSQMVLVGHSMGGLVAQLQVASSGTTLWDSICCAGFDEIFTTPATRHRLAETYFFEPLPMVSSVVFIGTPHCGSPWANRPLGRLGSCLVDEPPSFRNEHRQLIQDNPGLFSSEFSEGVPTSIDLLEPQSCLLQAINRLPLDPRVRLHSIIGEGYWMLGGGNSDKVVPVSSAFKPGVDSNRFIHAKHTRLHFVPAGVNELIRILCNHAAASGPFQTDSAPTEITIRPTIEASPATEIIPAPEYARPLDPH